MKQEQIHAKVYGIVQGVGFRPFVSRLASRYALRGLVMNKGPYVEIVVQGSCASLQSFFIALKKEAPSRASILAIEKQVETPKAFDSFAIVESKPEEGEAMIPPDIGICETCQQELFDPQNRRYLHPFINCTNCGPRLTILQSLPYDRERTSMAKFPMCADCQAEYFSSASRRYDAQPIACHACGPSVYLLGRKERGRAAITEARRILSQGGILAIKGIGGFHLACEATNSRAVQLLRARKHRPQKPFAVMFRDWTTAEQFCKLSEVEKQWLTSWQKPIVLLQKNPDSGLAPEVAPANPTLGAMLPYAPLQMLLFSYPDDLEVAPVLVMTSGNVAGAPICRTDTEAVESLADIADGILSHDRDILLRADDSVLSIFDDEPYMLRRSRGFAPMPIFLPAYKNAPDVLAMGGELKNAFCFAKAGWFYLSPHVGDLSDLRAVEALQTAIAHLQDLLHVHSTCVAVDPHPRYQSQRVGRSYGLPVYEVQHHFAHVLACMAENGYTQEVLGIAYDGTGYGTDDSIWGGEILQASPQGFKRVASIEPFLQAGGDRSAREGWRIALAFLYANDEAKACTLAQTLGIASEKEWHPVCFQLQKNINVVASTSMGRLFDAVSALLGLCHTSNYEGQAAMALQFAAERAKISLDETCTFTLKRANDGRLLLPTHALFMELVRQRQAGVAVTTSALYFHRILAKMTVQACQVLRERTGLQVVALTGGVMQNRLLLSLLQAGLQTEGFQVLRHHLVPPNDGGIALGQAFYAVAKNVSRKGQ